MNLLSPGLRWLLTVLRQRAQGPNKNIESTKCVATVAACYTDVVLMLRVGLQAVRTKNYKARCNNSTSRSSVTHGTDSLRHSDTCVLPAIFYPFLRVAISLHPVVPWLPQKTVSTVCIPQVSPVCRMHTS